MAVAASASGADPRPRNLAFDTPMAQEISAAVIGLDAWFDRMRQPGGYGGPVIHWWRDCLEYTGPGLDWRYEGVIIGYLNLWSASRDRIWLDKACQAGDDLIAGQLPSGNYRNSRFEQNPGTGGTPHEAACDLALIRLSTGLRSSDDPDWQKYSQAAERNLKQYFIARLWDPDVKSFRDDPITPSFVPNKAATLAEALLNLAWLTGDAVWADRYALPTLLAVIRHQEQGSRMVGGIYQNSFRNRRVPRFYPFYIARCIPGLIEGYRWCGEDYFVDSALQAAKFVLRYRYPDGSFPQVVYPNGKAYRYPQWVAGVGDLLRALELARGFGVEYDLEPSLHWLLAGRRADGAFCTAEGFERSNFLHNRPDPRNELAVCGWIDKAFRYLTSLVVLSPQT